jgi:hypothetical protein
MRGNGAEEFVMQHVSFGKGIFFPRIFLGHFTLILEPDSHIF